MAQEQKLKREGAEHSQPSSNSLLCCSYKLWDHLHNLRVTPRPQVPMNSPHPVCPHHPGPTEVFSHFLSMSHPPTSHRLHWSCLRNTGCFFYNHHLSIVGRGYGERWGGKRLKKIKLYKLNVWANKAIKMLQAHHFVEEKSGSLKSARFYPNVCLFTSDLCLDLYSSLCPNLELCSGKTWFHEGISMQWINPVRDLERVLLPVPMPGEELDFAAGEQIGRTPGVWR